MDDLPSSQACTLELSTPSNTEEVGRDNQVSPCRQVFSVFWEMYHVTSHSLDGLVYSITLRKITGLVCGCMLQSKLCTMNVD